MSGGVDSSVAAALLKRSGYDVTGVFLRCYETEGCRTFEDLSMARLAARKIGIPFYTFDFRQEYKKRVIDYFVKSYAEGLTPNPDIICNKEIKFGLLFEKAMSLGFDYLATGHYARLRREIQNPKSQIQILKGKDLNKDQSYFLYRVATDVLRNVVFPIGDYKKTQVRKLAKKFGLPNADKPDSQGICFVGKVKLEDFLKKFIPPKRGEIVDGNGRIVGFHKGAHYFTIGQRRGLRLAGGPYYVLEKDVQKNILVVTKRKRDLLKREAVLRDVVWLGGKLPQKINVKIRYRHPGAPATLYKIQDTKYKILFSKPQFAVAPGQSAVFYKREQLLGGGIIDSA